MASLIRTKGQSDLLPIPVNKLPILYQEEEDDGMGEANLHTLWAQILYTCIKAHLVSRPQLQVYANLNLYYRKGPLHPKTKSKPNVAADTMVVEPFAPLPISVESYTFGEDGPAPLLAAEVLSERTAKKRDLNQKLVIYAGLAVVEYLLADPTGQFMPQPLLLKRLRADGTWEDQCDADGGVTSKLGFRVIVEEDRLLRVIDRATGKRYIRPDEANNLCRELEDKVRALEAEIRARNGSGGKKGSRRRKT